MSCRHTQCVSCDTATGVRIMGGQRWKSNAMFQNVNRNGVGRGGKGAKMRSIRRASRMVRRFLSEYAEDTARADVPTLGHGSSGVRVRDEEGVCVWRGERRGGKRQALLVTNVP